MKHPFFKLYAADMALELVGLSIEARGAHLSLLVKAWESEDCAVSGPVTTLMRMCGYAGTPEGWAGIMSELSGLWRAENGQKVVSPRLEALRTEADRISAARASAAEIRWTCKRDANEMQMHSIQSQKSEVRVRSQKSESQSRSVAPRGAQPSGRPPAGKRTRIPADLELTPPLRAHAVAAGVPAADVGREWAQFCDHHRAKGSTMADWSAAWRTWAANAVKFARGSPRNARAQAQSAIEAWVQGDTGEAAEAVETTATEVGSW